MKQERNSILWQILLDWHLTKISLRYNTAVKCRCNAIKFTGILHRALRWRQNPNQILYSQYSQKTPHTSPSRTNYEVSIMRIWEEIDSVIMVSYWILLTFRVRCNKYQTQPEHGEESANLNIYHIQIIYNHCSFIWAVSIASCLNELLFWIR